MLDLEAFRKYRWYILAWNNKPLISVYVQAT